MKILIWQKIALLTSVLVAATTIPLALQIIHECRDVVVKRQLNDLTDQATLRGARLLDRINDLHRDSLQLSGDSTVRSLLWQETDEAFFRLQQRMTHLLEQHPQYLQAQFIKREPIQEATKLASSLGRMSPAGLAGPLNPWQISWLVERMYSPPRGEAPRAYRELVRVRKKKDGTVVVKTFDNDRPSYTLHPELAYLTRGFNLTETKPNDQVGFSSVRRDRELEEPGLDPSAAFVLQAVVRLSRGDTRDRRLRTDGLVIVTLDFRQLASELANSGRYLTYLLDEHNNLLVHPDKQAGLGFNRQPKPLDANEGFVAEVLKDIEVIRLKKYQESKEQGSADPDQEADLAVQRHMETIGITRDNVRLAGGMDVLKLQLNRTALSDATLKELNQKLQQVSRDTLLALSPDGSEAAPVTRNTFEIVLRGRDRKEVVRVGEELLNQFQRPALRYFKGTAPILSQSPILESNCYAIHCCRLRISPPGAEHPRFFKLALATSQEELSWDIDQKSSVLYRTLFWGLLLAVAATLLVSWWITRPLKKITRATERFAQGDYNVPLPVRDRGEVGQLAQSFQRMGQEIQSRTQKLEESESRNRTILEMAAEGIVTVNQWGTIEGFNRAAERMFGYALAEVAGQPLKLLLHRPHKKADTPPDGGPSEDSFNLDKLTHLPREMEGLRKDGSHFPMELAGSAILVKVTDVVGKIDDRRLFTCIVRDITERKKAEEAYSASQRILEEKVRERTAELRRAMRQLEMARDVALAASRAKDAFVASVSHELRTPLFHVDSFAQLLEYTTLDEDQKSDLTKIRRASSHLLDLVNDLLDYQKIIMGKIPLELKDFQLNALVEETVEQSRSRVGDGGNTLNVECPPNLPTMHSDQKRVRQVLYNLLSNGLKFTDQGTVTLTVAPLEANGVPGVRFRVSDTGIGMTAEQMKKLFQPFQRLHNQVTKPGNGLGLAISRELCQAMGGSIEVASTPGKGSTFTVWLPLRSSEPEELRPDAGVPPSGGSAAQEPPEGGTPTPPLVLVIDDDPDVCELMRRFLEKDGFRIELAGNGKDGLRLAQQLRPAAITLDIRMPEPDGWKVLSLLKQDPETAGIPVIVVSMLDDRSHGFALGASDFLTKPFDWSRLSELLTRYPSPGRLGADRGRRPRQSRCPEPAGEPAGLGPGRGRGWPGRPAADRRAAARPDPARPADAGHERLRGGRGAAQAA